MVAVKIGTNRPTQKILQKYNPNTLGKDKGRIRNKD